MINDNNIIFHIISKYDFYVKRANSNMSYLLPNRNIINNNNYNVN